ncbi:putative serine/threonine-protein kinase irlA isoform X1 [Clavelina lepadiformis]
MPPYKVLRKIAGGGQGGVVFVCEKNDESLCAGKEVNKSTYTNLKNEIEILKEVAKNHENIVHYFDYFDKDLTIVIYMELCDATVQQFVENKFTREMQPETQPNVTPQEFFNDITPLQICLQAVKGVEYLHSNDIIHRDIKPSNFLIVKCKGKTLVKVSDFGLSRQLLQDQSGIYTESNGTRGYMPQECYDHGSKWKMTADIFSLGVFIHFVVTGGFHPFGSKGYKQEGNIRERKTPNFEALLKSPNVIKEHDVTVCDMIRRMIKHNPADRFTIANVLKHPSFWNSKEKVEFYKTLNTHLRHIAPNKLQHLSIYDRGLLQKGMDRKTTKFQIQSSHLPQPVITDKYFSECSNLQQLLTLIRNMEAHGRDAEKSNAEKECLGMDGLITNWDKFLESLTGAYPQLLVHLYESFRDKNIAIEFYKTTPIPPASPQISRQLANVSLKVDESPHKKKPSVSPKSKRKKKKKSIDPECNEWMSLFRKENIPDNELYQFEIQLEYGNHARPKNEISLRHSPACLYHKTSCQSTSVESFNRFDFPPASSESMIQKVLDKFDDGIILHQDKDSNSLMARRCCLVQVWFTSHLQARAVKMEQQKIVELFSYEKFYDQSMDQGLPKSEVKLYLGKNPDTLEKGRIVPITITIRPVAASKLTDRYPSAEGGSIDVSYEKCGL